VSELGVSTGVNQDLPEVSAVRRLHLGPGDKLVVTCPHPLSVVSAARLKSRLIEVFGPNLPFLILDGGMDVEVVETR